MFFLLCPGVEEPVDAFFLIDTSRGITERDLRKMKELVLQQGIMYNVSSDDTRISVISYSDRASTELPLNRGTSTRAIRNALYSIGLTGRQRRVEVVLQSVRNKIANKLDGVKDDRGKVVVLMVGGRSDPFGLASAKLEADGVKSEGGKIVVVGIGSDLDETVLKSVATKPDAYVAARDGDEVVDATGPISDMIKDAGKTSVAVDIGFVLGADGANAGKDFRLGKRAIIAMVKKLDVSQGKVRVGLISYGERASVVVRLDSLTDGERFAKVVEKLQFSRPGFALSDAAELARSSLFSERYGARRGVPKTAVIFVNREIDDASKVAADELRKRGVKVVAVSLGDKDSSDSLKKITNSDGDVSRIERDDDIGAFAKKAASSVLPGEDFGFVVAVDFCLR